MGMTSRATFSVTPAVNRQTLIPFPDRKMPKASLEVYSVTHRRQKQIVPPLFSL